MSRRAPIPVPGHQAQAPRQSTARTARQAQANAHTPTPSEGPSQAREAGLFHPQDHNAHLPPSIFAPTARPDAARNGEQDTDSHNSSSAEMDGEGSANGSGEGEGDLEDGLDNDEIEGEFEAPSRPPSPSLREISSLASWTVSTYKPGCGVRELLSANTSSFWQSDGPQPHLLTIHFFKVVGVVRMRIYLDQELDESYTPTRMVFAAGMGEHDLVEFGEWRAPPLAEQAETGGPRGWIEVDLDGVGGRDSGRGYGVAGGDGDVWGRDDGKVLRCMCVQIRVLENHQNGKDTHIRGVQLFARDERVVRSGGMEKEVVARLEEKELLARLEEIDSLGDGLLEPEWALEMPIR